MPVNPKDAWNAAYTQLEMQLDRASFDTWLRDAVQLKCEGDVFVIGVRNGYARDMLQHRLYRNVRRILSDIYGQSVELRFEVRRSETAKSEMPPQAEMPLFRLLAQQESHEEPPAPLHRQVARPQRPDLPEGALPHWELVAKYGIIDFELGNKITGAGFPVYKGKGARLQRAMINFFLDQATKAGYSEVQPPILINEASGFGTGQLPDKEGQMYHVGVDDLYLIPTAEVPITNLYRDTIVKESDFPIKHTAYTPCFRREAGSYGAHVRGLNRLHQFDKVEVVQVVHPDQSYAVLEEMSTYVQSLLQALELPYRVLRLCGGDMGFTSALTYDMEVWSAAQQRWLEVSSVSNFETYQANRLKVRFKGEGGKTQLAHTLNGSALALPRILASILENNQTADAIKVPDVLVPYTGFDWID